MEDDYLPAICQVLRSGQKDEQYVNDLTGQVNDSFKTLFGDLLWIRYSKHIKNCIKWLYYTSTTGAGNQTLGEEYCHLVQSCDDFQSPSIIRRNILVVLYSFHQELLQKFSSLIRLLSSKYGGNKIALLGNRYKVYTYLLNIWDTLSKLNSIIFNFTLKHADLPKRLLSINQLTILKRENLNLNSDSSKYFGFISLIEFVLSLVNTSRIYLNDRSPDNDDLQFVNNNHDGKSCNSKSKCLLCFGGVVQSSVTVCGHIFCWNCIIKYVNLQQKCPSCQQSLQLRDIVYLKNYD